MKFELGQIINTEELGESKVVDIFTSSTGRIVYELEVLPDLTRFIFREEEITVISNSMDQTR